jgi:nucleotide-binding universal stress UspA family protein
MYKKILLATDGSENSIRATDGAIEIAKCDPASVMNVVYVVNGDTSKSDVLRNWNSADIADNRRDKIKPTEDKIKEAGINYEVKFLHGDPGPTLVKYANENNFDLVVIGSRGLNALQEFVLGSVSHKVAKRANCPVLIVK